MLEEYGFVDAKPVSTPLELNVRKQQIEKYRLSDPTIYRKLAGELLYLTFSRLDVNYATHVLS